MLPAPDVSTRVVRLVAKESRRVVVLAGGTSEVVARRLARLLTVAGVPAESPPAPHGAGSRRSVSPTGRRAVTGCGVQDTVLVLGHDGRSPVLVDLLDLANDHGAATVAVVSSVESPVGRAAEIVVPVRGCGRSVGTTTDSPRLPTAAAWSDALADAVVTCRGTTWREAVRQLATGTMYVSQPRPDPGT